jgi:ABC-2 type transport system permease protein
MPAALLIAGKDLRQRLRDRSALLVAVVVPLALALIFGLIFHNVTSGRVTFVFGLVDRDRGPAARAFASTALGPLERQGLVTVRRQPSLNAGRSAVEHGSVSATFVLPAGFSLAVGRGRPATLLVLGNLDAPIGAEVAHAIASAYASRIDTIRIATAALGAAAPTATQLAASPEPVVISDVSTRSRQLGAGTFYAAGMAVFFLFFTVQFGVASLLDERRDGTLARMLAAPIHRTSILAGKVLTSLVLGWVSMGVLAVATHILIGADWGDPLSVAILIASGVVAATGVMALVVTLARTYDQAQAWQSMVAIVMGMLGGTFFPVAQTGGVLETLSLATPQAWFLRGVENLAGGAGASVVLGPAAAMLTVGALSGSLAFWRAGRLIAR